MSRLARAGSASDFPAASMRRGAPRSWTRAFGVKLSLTVYYPLACILLGETGTVYNRLRE